MEGRRGARLAARGLILAKDTLYIETSRGLKPLLYARPEPLRRVELRPVPSRLGAPPAADDEPDWQYHFELHTGEERTWPLTVSQTDARDREPAYIRRLPPASIASLRTARDGLGPALEVLGSLEGVEQQTCYNATGLLQADSDGDTTPVFLHPGGGAITATGARDDRYQTALPDDIAAKVEECAYGFLPPAPDPATAAADAQTLLHLFEAADREGVPDSTRALGAVLLGIVGFAPLSQASPTGGPPVLIYGTTGSLKSAWARLTLSCYGRVHGRAEPATINAREMATKIYAVEQILHALPGVPAVVDDGNKGKSTEKLFLEFYKLISLLGSHAATRRGIDRGKNAGGRGQGGFWKTWYPRGIVVGTAESLPQPEQSASELARWAILQLEPGQANPDLLTTLQQQPAAEALNRATSGYIAWLLPRIDQVLAEVDQLRGAYEQLGLHMRMPDTYARLEAGFRAVLTYISQTAGLDDATVAAYTEIAHQWLTAMAVRQADALGVRAGRAEALAPVPHFWRVFRHALREGRLYLSSAKRDEHGLPQPPAGELLPDGHNPTTLGWQPRVDRDGEVRWEFARGALEAGIYARGRGHDWPYTARIRVTNWPGDVYSELERLAIKLGHPLPGPTEMLSLLEAEGHLRGAGRGKRGYTGTFWTDKAERARLLDLRPLLSPVDDQDDHGDDDHGGDDGDHGGRGDDDDDDGSDGGHEGDGGGTPPASSPPLAPPAGSDTATPATPPEPLAPVVPLPTSTARRPPTDTTPAEALDTDLTTALAALTSTFGSVTVLSVDDHQPPPNPDQPRPEQPQLAPQATPPADREPAPTALAPTAQPPDKPPPSTPVPSRRDGRARPRVTSRPFRVGVLGRAPDSDDLGLYRPARPVTPAAPRTLADLISLATGEHLDQLWVAPDAHPLLGIPGWDDLSDQQQTDMLLGPVDGGLPPGVLHPFVTSDLARIDVRPEALIGWLHGWLNDPHDQRGRPPVDVAFAGYMDPDGPLTGLHDAPTLLAALLRIYHALGVRYRRSPRATFVDALQHVNRGLEWWGPGDAAPPPPSRGARLGREQMTGWVRPLTPAEQDLKWIHSYDINGQHGGAMSSLYLGLGTPQHLDNPEAATKAFDPNLPGLWRLAALPEAPDELLFNPYHPRPPATDDIDGDASDAAAREIWRTTPTLALAHELGQLPQLQILEAWIWPQRERVFRHVYELLRKTRGQLLTETGPVADTTTAVVKGMYSAGAGHFSWRGWEDWERQHGHPHPHHRPEYHWSVIAQARANLYRRLRKVKAASGRTPFAVQVDEVYFLSNDPNGRTAAPEGLPLGKGFGEFKPTGTCLAEILTQVDEPTRPGRVFRALTKAMEAAKQEPDR